VPKEYLRTKRPFIRHDLGNLGGVIASLRVQLVKHRCASCRSVAYLGACCYEQTTYIKVTLTMIQASKGHRHSRIQGNVENPSLY
jgi:hypothetical protein